MMLYFAYGSNMCRPVMQRHAPAAEPVGVAELRDHRFVITADGYASVEPAAGEAVFGVLWRITPRDRATLDAWEDVSGGLYRAEIVPIRHGERSEPALIYFGRPGPAGRPRQGYMEVVIEAARQWQLPDAYIAALRQRSAATPHAEASKLGDFAWK